MDGLLGFALIAAGISLDELLEEIARDDAVLVRPYGTTIEYIWPSRRIELDEFDALYIDLGGEG